MNSTDGQSSVATATIVMAEKQKPLGICDHCGDPIPAGDWYTTKHRPRLYCSVDCRNAANARAGGPKIAQKNRERMARGEWRNPHHLNPLPQIVID